MSGFSSFIIAQEEPAEVKKALDHINPVVEEIILIYTNKEKREEMEYMAKKMPKVRFFYIIKLGVVEVYRQYAMSLCTNDWIIAFDTDERFGAYTLANLDAIAKKNENIAYKIIRKEAKGHTWQYRIYNKHSLLWKGLVHEHPIIKGESKNLDKKFTMEHFHNYDIPVAYNAIQKYQRQPLLWIAMRNLAIRYTITKKIELNKIFEEYKKNKIERDSLTQQEKNIIKRIKEEGMAKIIGSDNAIGISELNAKYSKEQGGTELLIKILKDKIA